MWAFNKKNRESARPLEIDAAVKWVVKNTLSVSRLDDAAKLRSLLEKIALKLDGKPAAGKTVSRKRAVVFSLLEYAVERKALRKNLLPTIKWAAPPVVRAIDKRVVINHDQAKALLAAVAAQGHEKDRRKSAGPRLVAYFASMYYSGLRPEEVAMLSKPNLRLPETGWGELLLSDTAPVAGKAWTDSGERRDRRNLKQRAREDVRTVPCPPQLTVILHDHLRQFGLAADGRLFRSIDGGYLAESTIQRVWDKARKSALSEDEYTSPLARRPYDLRHACVSTWLAAGVQSTQCAEWAGHSVAVLHEVYAKVIAGLEQFARDRIEAALAGKDFGTYLAQLAA